jgi:hypothetical protein
MVRTFRRPLVLLVLVLLAGAGSAHAVPAAESPREAKLQNPLVLAWDWMASVFDKVGSFIDPNGGELNPNPQDRTTSSGMGTDVGSFIDPNGNS